MEKYELQVRQLLCEHGAVLVRTKRHDVYRTSDGAAHVLPQSPSDYRAWRNKLAELRKALGLADPERGRPGDRRERKRKPGAAPSAPPTSPAAGVRLREWGEDVLAAGQVLFGVTFDRRVVRVRTASARRPA